jgi:RHH-type rel operon transcriptional repressor/antitoxin RelB
MFTINLPKDIENRLQSLSLSTGRTMQYYAREAILEHLDGIEDRFLALHRCGDVIAEDVGERGDYLVITVMRSLRQSLNCPQFCIFT